MKAGEPFDLVPPARLDAPRAVERALGEFDALVNCTGRRTRTTPAWASASTRRRRGREPPRTPFVHVSTDYAFEGDPYGAVAGRRRAGQRLRRWGKLRPDCENAVVLRAASLTAGASGKRGNFVETIAGKEKGALRAVADQTMSPTAAAAPVVPRILASGCAHLVNAGAATRSPAKSSASPEPS